MVDHQGRFYLDDRMYVLEISSVKSRTVEVDKPPQAWEEKWAVITRRNVRGYPPTRTDEFDTREEAVAYLKAVVPSTPLVSLDGASPNPPLTYVEYQDWLDRTGIGRLPY